MKRLALLALGIITFGTAAHAQVPPTTTTTTTTTETPVGTTTTTTDVTAPVATAPVAAPTAPVAVLPPPRDAITGQPVDVNAAADANDDASLRDKVRAKISNEAQVKQ